MIFTNDLWKTEAKTTQDLQNVELHEGDIVLSKKQKARYTVSAFFFDLHDNLIQDPWPDKVIKYRHEQGYEVDKTMLSLAMKAWTDLIPCIKFEEDNSSPVKDVLVIELGRITYATMGYDPSREYHTMGFGKRMATKQVAIHLLGHVIGLPHTHSRPDRDAYLRWFRHNTNIEDMYYLNYKYEDCPYDFSSAMHLNYYAFTVGRNGEIAFDVPVQSWTDDPYWKKALMHNKKEGESWSTYMMLYIIGRWDTPSLIDAINVEIGYGCRSSSQGCQTFSSLKHLKIYPAPETIVKGNYYMLLRQPNPDVNDYYFSANDIPDDQHTAIDMIYTYADEVKDDDVCNRMLTLFQLAQRPTYEQMSYWLLSGCTFMQVDIYDKRFDHHEVFCAADFARMQRKAIFTSLSTQMFVRVRKLDDAIVKTMQDGFISSVGFIDYICTGHATTDPPCQGVPDKSAARGFHFNTAPLQN